MRHGADRTDGDYIWPATLRTPERPPKLVYLDLGHWIALAKVVAGRPDGKARKPILDACVRAVEDGTAVFPISDAIYMEVSKIGTYRQRRDLREVIELVSRYRVVTSRSDIAAHEIESLLDREIGPNPKPVNFMDYLDWGIFRAFGRAGGLRVKSQETGDDVTEEFRASFRDGRAAFDAIVAKATLGLNRSVLDGPKDQEEEEKLRRQGWDPRAALRIAQRRADQEQEQVGRFDEDPKWRKGRIRDVVAARELLIELEDPWNRGLVERGVRVGEVFGDRDKLRRAGDSMPSFDVAVTIKTSYHADPGHRWTPNDIMDIDALGSTIPYCDIVVTDKAVASQVKRTGLDERIGTAVISDLDSLPALLGRSE